MLCAPGLEQKSPKYGPWAKAALHVFTRPTPFRLRHIVVLRNGNFYKVDTLDADGNILSPAVIKGSIQHILADETPRNQESIALMTTENRDVWAEVRCALNSKPLSV